jgi:hypothetical protein
MRRPIALTLLAITAIGSSAPAALAAEPIVPPPVASEVEPLSPERSFYCFYVDPATVGTTVVYPGGKYCVPGP